MYRVKYWVILTCTGNNENILNVSGTIKNKILKDWRKKRVKKLLFKLIY